VNAAERPYSGPKMRVAVGKFENRSNYLHGIFSDGVDRLGEQGKTILISHLQSSGRFSVMERENLSETKQEATFSGQVQHISGATYIITGGVTEFGRKEVGDQQLFGIAGSGKSQIAYCKVAINVVDVATSEVVATASGAGEYALSSREVLGFGGSSGYDSTLNGKVLDLAMREAVDRLVSNLESGKWNTAH
jgi:curli biogenesis system outer membrane secretion channel CsgG